jgi:hypothetical protein
MSRRLAVTLLLAASACLGPRQATTASAPASPPGLPTHAAACRPHAAQACAATGCADASEGLHAEQFELDVVAGTLGACLYTDCYTGPALLVREPEAPWRVSAFGVVRSERPVDGVPPPGSAPFPLTISVDLRDGRFTATWAHSPDGLQADFGTCQLRWDE